jgi:hypothetical protein
MLKTYLFIALCFLSFLPTLGQNQLDLRSPDKQKYFAGGAVIGGASYAFFHSHYTRIATRENRSKIHLKSLAAATATSFTVGLLKQAYDLNTAKYNYHADDYALDVASILLGSLTIGISIPLIF